MYVARLSGMNCGELKVAFYVASLLSLVLGIPHTDLGCTKWKEPSQISAGCLLPLGLHLNYFHLQKQRIISIKVIWEIKGFSLLWSSYEAKAYGSPSAQWSPIFSALLMKVLLHLVRRSQVISTVYPVLFVWAEHTCLPNLQEIWNLPLAL